MYFTLAGSSYPYLCCGPVSVSEFGLHSSSMITTTFNNHHLFLYRTSSLSIEISHMKKHHSRHHHNQTTFLFHPSQSQHEQHVFIHLWKNTSLTYLSTSHNQTMKKRKQINQVTIFASPTTVTFPKINGCWENASNSIFAMQLCPPHLISKLHASNKPPSLPSPQTWPLRLLRRSTL